jgi:hypothetical protein
MEVFLASVWVAVILFLLYETSVVYSYLKRLRFLNFITLIKEYDQDLRKGNWTGSYSSFMQYYREGFFTDLFTCRYCVGAWAAIGASYFCGFEYTPLVYMASQLEYSGFKVLEKYLSRIGEDSDE